MKRNPAKNPKEGDVLVKTYTQKTVRREVIHPRWMRGSTRFVRFATADSLGRPSTQDLLFKDWTTWADTATVEKMGK